MKYTEITVETTAEFEDVVSDILFSVGSEGVEVENSQEINSFIKQSYNFDYYDESALKQQSTVIYLRGFFKGKKNAESVEKALNEVLNDGAFKVLSASRDDKEWRDKWKEFYKPLDFGSVYIVPEWMDVETDKPKLFLDPGSAFGTGGHETTAMCLLALEKLSAAGKTVADLGTGSGILGLSAAVLGAEKAYLTDIDGDAIKKARDNAHINNLTDKCEFIQGDLFSACEDIKFDLVFANIVADVLLRLSSTIKSRLKVGAFLILSGILAGREEEVRFAYEKAGLTIESVQKMGEWIAIIAKNTN